MPQSSGGGSSVATISADAFEWGTKTANRYVANFSSTTLLNNAVFGDLIDVGWEESTATAPLISTTATTGDLDSASDVGNGGYVEVASSGNRFSSPPVVGGFGIIEAIRQAVGTRPTVINVWAVVSFGGTTDSADTTGIGICKDSNSTLTSADGGYWLTVGATNFELWDGAAATDLGVAKDTSAHYLEIEITLSGATYRVLLDGTERKAAAAVTQDIWPMMLNATKGASGDAARVYAWGVNYD